MQSSWRWECKVETAQKGLEKAETKKKMELAFGKLIVQKAEISKFCHPTSTKT